MKTRFTPTAWSQGASNAMVCGIGVLGTLLTLSWLVSWITGKGMADSGAIAFAIFWIACLLGLVVSWALGLQGRGSLLLDCGGHPTRWLFLVNAAIVAVAGIAGGFTNSLAGAWGSLFAFSFSAYWVMMGSGRLGIHENGIWAYWGLVKWSRIREHSWADDGTLVFRSSGALSFFMRGAIPVPLERVAAFKDQLSQHLPVTPNA